MKGSSFWVRFAAPQFTSTEWKSAEDKAKFANALALFIEDGCLPEKFTEALYGQLRSMFGHIAHYDRGGFSSTWFRTPVDRYHWLGRVLDYKPVGDPAATWSDVEKAIIKWLSETDHLERFRLKTKYEWEKKC